MAQRHGLPAGFYTWRADRKSTRLNSSHFPYTTLFRSLVPGLTQRQDILNRLFLIFLYITLGQSWNILAGFAGQTNLGHAAFFGTGALVTRTLWLNGMAFPLAFILGGQIGRAHV